jgi:alpha-tubulin suppressor-like RCC1 family protein
VPPSLAPAIQICCGGDHTIALTTGGAVNCWGRNSSCECNVSDTVLDAIEISAGEAHSATLIN